MGMKHHRHSDRVTRSKRWKAVRLNVLRRDGWRCQSCSGPAREVDHRLPVRASEIEAILREGEEARFSPQDGEMADVKGRWSRARRAVESLKGGT